MSETKWAVLKDAYKSGWLVIHPGETFRVDDGRLDCWDVHSRHHTWEEAMQEADRQYRTETVTMPANPDRVLPVTKIIMSSDPEGAWTERTYRVAGQEITIPDAYREPLALALLAHARKRE